MELKIALAGNPNCGKTTLFNELTGSTQYVGNWPGVTVEKKEGRYKGNKDIVIQDLPGIYSLSPYTMEEVVSRNYLVNDKPDAILNIVDGTNIERNLYLTTQLLEIGIPMVIAINMMDLVEKNGDKINIDELSKNLGCPIIPISAIKGQGIDKAINKVVEVVENKKIAEHPHVFSGSVEHALAHIEESILNKTDKQHVRWFAVKIFERDKKAYESLGIDDNTINHIEEHIVDCEKEMDDISESIITSQRYSYIENIVNKTVVKNRKVGELTVSDKVDKILTHRIFALPIFVAIMFLVFSIAMGNFKIGNFEVPTNFITAGATDFANDGVFGDGWFLFGKGRDKYDEAVEEYNAQIDEQLLTEGIEMPNKEEYVNNLDGYNEEAKKYYDAFETKAEELGLEEPDPKTFGLWIPGIPVLVEKFLDKIGCTDIIKSLVIDGIIGGVGTVLGFVPQIAILFLFLSILEDSGYMARVAFIFDRIFRRFGLSGKSFIPMLIGTGCGVPAIMAARTIEEERDRRMTIMLSTFIPCGAKMEIVLLMTSIFFPDNGLIATSMYFLGIAIIILSGIALKKLKYFSGEPAPFVMELPAYHLPSIKGVFIHVWERVKAFMIKAGTIIFIVCVILWFLGNFNFSLQIVDKFGPECILRYIGDAIAFLFAPLGFGTWQGAVASVSAELAKEQATATLGLIANSLTENESDISVAIQNFFHNNQLAGLSFMIFNIFNAPCLVAIITAFKEQGNKK